MENNTYKTVVDNVLNRLSDNDYIKYLRIDKMETINDYSITYKKNRNNKGSFTILNKTIPIDKRFVYEYKEINGYSFIINDSKTFDNHVKNYLKEYSNHFGFCDGTDYSIWFIIKIKFSNGDKIHIVVDTNINRELTLNFYEYLSKLKNWLIER